MTEPCALTTLARARFDAARPAAPATVLLIEGDDDCADALEVLLAGLPSVRAVRATPTTQHALAEIEQGHLPDLILIDSCVGAHTLSASIQTLRLAAPRAAIVMLCLYPEALSADIAAQVDDVISKDTRRSELLELLARLHGQDVGAMCGCGA